MFLVVAEMPVAVIRLAAMAAMMNKNFFILDSYVVSAPKIASLCRVSKYLSFWHEEIDYICLMKFLRNNLQTILLLAGIVAGGICGAVFGDKVSFVKPVGDIFLNFVFVMVVPLIFFGMSSAVFQMSASGKMGRMAGVSLTVFLAVALCVGTLAWLGIKIFNPLSGAALSGDVSMPVPGGEATSVGDMVTGALSVGDFPLLLSKLNLLPLILFSILLGVAASLSGKYAPQAGSFLSAASGVASKMMDIIMKAAPIGLGCYFAVTVSSLGRNVAGAYLKVLLMYLAVSAVVYFVFNTAVAAGAGGTDGVKKWWKHILSPSLAAIATSSSAACIGINIEAAKKMGVRAPVAEAVIPLGTHLHKDGSVIGGVMKIAFLFALTSVTAGSSLPYFTVVPVAILVGTVMGAIPTGGMTGELLICSVFGFPPEMAAVLMVISTIIDIPATLLNSSGNVLSALVVDKFL